MLREVFNLYFSVCFFCSSYAWLIKFDAAPGKKKNLSLTPGQIYR